MIDTSDLPRISHKLNIQAKKGHFYIYNKIV